MRSLFVKCSKIIIVLIAIFSLSVSVFAYTEGDFTYGMASSNAVTITRYNGNSTGKVVIPSRLGGYPVISISTPAFSGGKFAELVISEGVQVINTWAFGYCENLKTVTIPRSVSKISGLAFIGCTSLTTVYYNGTLNQWNAISKETDWDRDSRYTLVCLGEAVSAPTILSASGCSLSHGYQSGGPKVVARVGNGLSISYQWYLSSTNSNTGGTILVGQTKSNYSVPLKKQPGTTEYYYCIVTAKREVDGATATAKTAALAVNYLDDGSHSYVIKEERPASCTSSGTISYECKYCPEKYIETVDALGHKWQVTQTVEPTCTKNGYSIYVCERCSGSYTADEISATGVHKYDASFVWSEDHMRCIAQLRCNWNCGADIKINCTVENDCSDPQWTEHIAFVEYEGEKYQTTLRCQNYLVTFKDWDDILICENYYHYGEKVAPPSDPIREEDTVYRYSFAGWDDAVTECYGNKTYTAKYDAIYVEYTIIFQYEDGTVIDEKIYHYGDSVIVPDSPSVPNYLGQGYEFIGWTPEITNCLGNVIYTAQFSRIYELGDVNGDGQTDNMDVEHLLWYTLYPEDYVLIGSGDFNNDGLINNMDVEYLLWHTLFPEEYPLTERTVQSTD